MVEVTGTVMVHLPGLNASVAFGTVPPVKTTDVPLAVSAPPQVLLAAPATEMLGSGCPGYCSLPTVSSEVRFTLVSAAPVSSFTISIV